MSSISKPMSKFLRKSILFYYCNITTLSQTSNNVCSLRHFSVSHSDRKHSFTVSYLISSLGFSPKAALSASRYVQFNSPNKPEKAIEFLTRYGFSETQISRLVRGQPRILIMNLDRFCLPKLEFLLSKGISHPELVKSVSIFPTVLACSLENQIMPAYDFIRNFFQSDKMAVTAIKRYPDIISHKIERYLAPNIAILREHGVPHSNIAALIRSQPKAIVIDSDNFRKRVEEVAEMGFDAARYSFIVALSVLRGLTKSTWEGKANVYKMWGWSDEEIMEAFKLFPRCMMLSEDNIMKSMDVFVNRVGLRPCVIARQPICLAYSLKKRVIPRLSVLEALLSKGLVKKVNMNTLLIVNENRFLQMFVEPYPKEAPELMMLYKKQLNIPLTLGVDKV